MANDVNQGFSPPPVQSPVIQEPNAQLAPPWAAWVNQVWARLVNLSGGAGISTSATSAPSVVPPPDVSGVTVSWVAAQADASGNPQILITVACTAPTPLGTFIGVEAYLDIPDSSGSLAIADGTQPADGTHPSAGLFNPSDVGFFALKTSAGTSFVFTFLWPAPKEDQYWRIYLPACSQSQKLKPIQHGQTGESPSYQFLVTAAGGGAPTGAYSSQGREFAPLVLNPELSAPPRGWSTNPLYEQVDSGDQEWKAAFDWEWPTSDPTLSKLASVNLILDDGSATFSNKIGSISTPPGGQIRGRQIARAFGNFQSTYQPVRAASITYTLYFQSVDAGGNANTIVPGVTPSVPFTVKRQKGSFGAEYTSLVTSDGVNPFITVGAVSAADGTALIRVTGYWANLAATPSWDQTFGGTEIVVLKKDGIPYNVAGGTLSPITNDIQQPAGVETWAFYLRSVDVNGRWNSIAPQLSFSGGGGSGAVAVAVVSGGVIVSVTLINGGTGYTSAPTVAVNAGQTTGGSGAVITCTVSGGAVNGFTISNGGSNYIATPLLIQNVGSAAGLLNLGKAATSSFATQFSIVGGVFTVGTLDAAVIKTGALQVGGGANMPNQLKVYDHLGSLIGWIGDDTGGSGFVGGWCKQFRIGGSSPSTAQIIADASGNVTFSGTLSAGISINSPVITGGSLTITSGNITVNIDGTNFFKITDTGSQNQLQWINGSALRITNTLIANDHADYSSAGFVAQANGPGSFPWKGSLSPGVVELVDSNTGGVGFEIDITSTYTATTASAGVQTLPTNPVGFLIVGIAGFSRKIPYYAT